MFIAALFMVAMTWRQPKGPSIEDWMKMMCSIYTMEYYAAIRKEILPFVTAWMDLESIMLSISYFFFIMHIPNHLKSRLVSSAALIFWHLQILFGYSIVTRHSIFPHFLSKSEALSSSNT